MKWCRSQGCWIRLSCGSTGDLFSHLPLLPEQAHEGLRKETLRPLKSKILMKLVPDPKNIWTLDHNLFFFKCSIPKKLKLKTRGRILKKNKLKKIKSSPLKWAGAVWCRPEAGWRRAGHCPRPWWPAQPISPPTSRPLGSPTRRCSLQAAQEIIVTHNF